MENETRNKGESGLVKKATDTQLVKCAECGEIVPMGTTYQLTTGEYMCNLPKKNCVGHYLDATEGPSALIAG